MPGSKVARRHMCPDITPGVTAKLQHVCDQSIGLCSWTQLWCRQPSLGWYPLTAQARLFSLFVFTFSPWWAVLMHSSSLVVNNFCTTFTSTLLCIKGHLAQVWLWPSASVSLLLPFSFHTSRESLQQLCIVAWLLWVLCWWLVFCWWLALLLKRSGNLFTDCLIASNCCMDKDAVWIYIC